MTGRGLGAICVATLLLAACSRGDPNLININRGQATPDEFAVLPTKPLEMPESRDLPPPTPGAGNRVDPTPHGDAVAALGGDPGRLQGTGQPRGEPALIRQTGRYGVQPDIREDLAEADYRFRDRRRGRVMERLFNVTTYWRAYDRYELDQRQALEAGRRAGTRTPAAPPEGAE
jgi:hypothetical protein